MDRHYPAYWRPSRWPLHTELSRDDRAPARSERQHVIRATEGDSVYRDGRWHLTPAGWRKVLRAAQAARKTQQAGLGRRAAADAAARELEHDWHVRIITGALFAGLAAKGESPCSIDDLRRALAYHDDLKRPSQREPRPTATSRSQLGRQFPPRAIHCRSKPPARLVSRPLSSARESRCAGWAASTWAGAVRRSPTAAPVRQPAEKRLAMLALRPRWRRHRVRDAPQRTELCRGGRAGGRMTSPEMGAPIEDGKLVSLEYWPNGTKTTTCRAWLRDKSETEILVLDERMLTKKRGARSSPRRATGHARPRCSERSRGRPRPSCDEGLGSLVRRESGEGGEGGGSEQETRTSRCGRRAGMGHPCRRNRGDRGGGGDASVPTWCCPLMKPIGQWRCGSFSRTSTTLVTIARFW